MEAAMSKMVAPARPFKEFKMARWIALALLPVMGALLDVPSGHAQAAAKPPEFEVAAVKPNPDCDPRRGGGGSSPGRMNLVCRTLLEYIQIAYGSFDGPHERWPRLEVLGGPSWVRSDRYDVYAKGEPVPYWQKASLMLRALLEERFQVRVHTEARDTSVYALTVVRNDPRLKRSVEDSCTPMDWDNPQQFPAQDRRAMSALFESSQRPCGSERGRMVGPNMTADWYGSTMAQFAAEGLAGRVFRPVVDKTGLTGLFDIHLEYSPDDAVSRAPGSDGPVAPPIGAKPGIFGALQDQLGLKLTAARAPIDVIVIDQAERPSGN